jgi:hypothetical protein
MALRLGCWGCRSLCSSAVIFTDRNWVSHDLGATAILLPNHPPVVNQDFKENQDGALHPNELRPPIGLGFGTANAVFVSRKIDVGTACRVQCHGQSGGLGRFGMREKCSES